jgi:PAS domain S-box-containing protein
MRAKFDSLFLRLLLGSCTPLVLFFTVALIAFLAIQRLVTALDEEKRTHEVIALALGQQESVGRMRAALRGLPFWDTPSSHEYRQERAEFHDRLARLEGLLPGEGEQQDRLASLRRREEEWGRQAEELIALSRAGDGPARQRAEAARARGEGEADALRADLTELVRGEEDVLERRRAQTADMTRQSEWLIGLTVPAVLTLSLLVALYGARAIARPVRRLRRATALMLGGDYEPVTPDGPAEIAHLTAHFNHLARAITERTRQLRQSEERYRRFVGATSTLLWTADASGAVVGGQPLWQAYTGQGADEVRGEGWLAAVHADDVEGTRAGWRQAVAEVRPFEAEFRVRSAAGGWTDFACHAVPIHGPDGRVREWLGACTDVTDRKRALDRQRARDVAEAVDRTRVEFLTRMSHELRTPLNAVIGMSKMLATERFGGLTAKQADYVRDIVTAGEHLLMLVNDILELTRLDSGKTDLEVRPAAVSALVGPALEGFRPAADARGVRVAFEPPRPDAGLATDGAKFRQVVANLVSNAVKFTPAGGSVAVRAEWVAGTEPEAPAAPEGEAAALRLTVADTGIGIDPRDLPAIWEEFGRLTHQPPRGPEGSGLGLVLTRRLVRLLGGTIAVASRPGAGSTFTVVVPRLLPSTVALVPEGAAADGSTPRDRPLALVIDDDLPTHKLLLDWLAEAGWEAASAFDGETGLAQARRLRPQLVLLDIQLPRRNGWLVLADLKRRPETAAIPVMVVTVTQDCRASDRESVQGFFVKPVEHDEFLNRLNLLRPQAISHNSSGNG